MNQNIGEYGGSNTFGWRTVRQKMIHAVATRPEGSIPVDWPRGLREPALGVLTPSAYPPGADVPMVEIINVFGRYDAVAHRIIPDSISFSYPHPNAHELLSCCLRDPFPAQTLQLPIMVLGHGYLPIRL